MIGLERMRTASAAMTGSATSAERRAYHGELRAAALEAIEQFQDDPSWRAFKIVKACTILVEEITFFWDERPPFESPEMLEAVRELAALPRYPEGRA